MSLIRANMVETASGTNVLSLIMPTGQSARVKGIRFYAAAAGAEDHDVTIDRKRILQFVAVSGLYFLSGNPHSGYMSIMDVITREGLFPVIPLASGETLAITAPGTSDYMSILYDLYEEGDVSADEPNGSKSNTYRLFQVISNSAAVEEAGDVALDQSELDSLFPAFPAGEIVPANTQMQLIGLFGAAASKGSGAANGQLTSFLKFLAEREDIFDKDLTGRHFLGDVSFTTSAVSYASIDAEIDAGVQYVEPRILVFESPIIFDSGQELNVYATVIETGAGVADFAAGDIQLGLIFDVVKV